MSLPFLQPDVLPIAVRCPAGLLAGIVLLLGACSAPLPYPPPASSLTPLATRQDARSLDDPALREFLAAAGAQLPAPGEGWRFEALALAAAWFDADVAAARLRWQAALERRRAGWLRQPLTVTGGIEHHDLNEAPRANPWTLGLGFELTLPSGDRVAARAAQLDSEVLQARILLAQAVWEARQRVREAWLSARAARARQIIAEQRQSLLEERAQRSRIRHDHGELARGELAAAEADAALGRRALSGAQRTVEAAEAALWIAAGLPAGPDRLPRLPPAALDADEDELLPAGDPVQAALDNRLDLRAAEARFQAADADLRWEVASQYPELTLNPGYEFDQGDHRLRIGFALPVRLPAAHRLQVEQAQAERDARAHEALARQDAILREVALDQRAIADAQAGRDAARQAVDVVEVECGRLERMLRLGAVDPVQVLDSRLLLNERQGGLIEAEQNLAVLRERLEDAIQLPLNALLSAQDQILRGGKAW